MPKVNLTAAQLQQLREWVDGGPTDPVGLTNWIAQNCPNPTTGESDHSCYQAQGERDLYTLLIQKATDGSNLRKQDITQRMADAFAWVDNSVSQWDQLGLPLSDNQNQMRPLWNFLRSL